MIKCFKKVLKPNELKNNYGFITFIFINTSFLIIFILFIVKYYQLLINKIIDIIEAKKLLEEKEKENKTENTNNNNKGNKNSKNKKHSTNTLKTDNTINKLKKSKTTRKKRKKIKLNNIPINNCTINLNFLDKDSSKIEIKNKENIKDENILELNDSEMNDLSYENALEKDDRNYSQYYLSLLKTNHLFFFVFINKADYNVKVIKIFLFIFSFTLNQTVNALFFNNKTMHKIYIDEGKYNFIYQIPQIIYSSVISVIINIIIKQLALSEKDILKIKQEKIYSELNDKQEGLLTKLKIKFIAFFILAFMLLIIFWSYITCFCGVYENNQSHLFKDSLIGFIFSLIYPFGIYLIPGIFRIKALKAEKKDKNYLYKFSQVLQFI